MRNEPIERRLARMESRIVQIMLHLGIDPYQRMYNNMTPTEDDYDDNESHQHHPVASNDS